jgi:hypothetical protein
MEGMRGGRLLVLVMCMMVLAAGCTHPKPTAEEEKALAMFQAVQQSLEASPAADAFARLLVQTESQLAILKQNPKASPCFVNALDKCFASYQIISKALHKKLGALDENRRQDIEMALSFSSAFAAISLHQAEDCYKRSGGSGTIF